jgi:hypothetical protein
MDRCGVGEVEVEAKQGLPAPLSSGVGAVRRRRREAKQEWRPTPSSCADHPRGCLRRWARAASPACLPRRDPLSLPPRGSQPPLHDARGVAGGCCEPSSFGDEIPLSLSSAHTGYLPLKMGALVGVSLIEPLHRQPISLYRFFYLYFFNSFCKKYTIDGGGEVCELCHGRRRGVHLGR